MHSDSGAIKLYWWKYKEKSTQLELVEVGNIEIASKFLYDVEKVTKEIDYEDDESIEETTDKGIRMQLFSSGKKN